MEFESAHFFHYGLQLERFKTSLVLNFLCILNGINEQKHGIL